MNPIIKTLLSASFFSNLAAGLFGPIYAVFVEEIGGDIMSAGTAWAVYLIAMGLFIIILGRGFDRRFNRKSAVILGYFLQAIGDFGWLLVDSPAKLIGVQILLGISVGIINPPWDALYSLALDKKKEVMEWSLWEGMVSIVRGLAAFIGALIAFQFGFRALFVLMGVLSLAAAFASLRLNKMPAAKHGRS